MTSGFVKFPASTTVSANTGYKIRIVTYDTNLNIVGATDNLDNYTITDVSKFYLLTTKTSDNSKINVGDFSNAVSVDLTDCIFYPVPVIVNYLLNYMKSGLDSVNEIIDTNNSIAPFSINRNLKGLENMVWEYQNWVFPQVISHKGYRDNLYFTFTTDGGYSGIAQYDFTTQKVSKTFLKKCTEANDHNLIAVLFASNNKIITACSGGHNTDRKMFIRISSARESIESFESPIVLEEAGLTSYAQLFEYNNKIFLFYRLDDKKWVYRISNDFGLTWSAATVLVVSNIQYYCQFTETTIAGVLRMLSYSNPQYDDSNIRESYLHLDDMTLYKEDNQTIIGQTNISPSSISIIIPVPTGKKLRLYNGAKTAIGDTKVLYSSFSPESFDDNEYYVYDNRNSYKVCDSGLLLNHLPSHGDLGMAWIGTSKIAVARNDNNGHDILEIYDYANGVVTFNKEVDRTTISSQGRLARPMVSNDNDAIIYWKGFYNINSYNDFITDGNVYIIE